MYLDFKHSYHSDDLSVLCSHLRQLSFCPTGGNSLSLSFRTDERLSKELRGWGMTMLCRCSFPPGRTQRRQIRLYWWFIRVVCVSREPHVLIFFFIFFLHYRMQKIFNSGQNNSQNNERIIFFRFWWVTRYANDCIAWLFDLCCGPNNDILLNKNYNSK